MKRNIEEMDFHKAFRPIPKQCYDALMHAAYSVKEEEPVKRAPWKAALIAALIIMAAMAVAFAATRLGWIDYYDGQFGITVPIAAKEALEESVPLTYQVGPMTFTFQQLLTDNHIAMSSAHVHMSDASKALYADDTNVYEAIGAISDTVPKLYELDPGMTWLEAARQLDMPLYGIRALIEVEEPYAGGESMEDALWNADGSIAYFSMPTLTPKMVDDALPLTLYMAVTEFDPETGEVMNKWTQRERITLPALPLLDERTYKPVDANEGNGIKLESVHAEQYATGIYLTAAFTMPEGISSEEAQETLYGLSILDGEGMELPDGLNLSTSADASTLPFATLEVMTSLEKLPNRLLISDGAVETHAE